jgi:hypothetical protein
LSFGNLRFGPTAIHNWLDKILYPNLRLMGLADFEHILPFSAFELQHNHYNHDLVRHDVYSMAIGQNLTEWALVMMHGATVNDLGTEMTTRIIMDGLERHARAVLPPGAFNPIQSPSVERAVRSTVRRFQTWGLMKGWVLHPLIMHAIKPYVEELRRVQAAGPGLSGHPVPWVALMTGIAALGLGWLPMMMLAGMLAIIASPGWLLPLLAEALNADLYGTLLGMILVPVSVCLLLSGAARLSRFFRK